MPFNVEQLLEASANDADEQIYKQRWRTGLEAYNDVEEVRFVNTCFYSTLNIILKSFL